MALLIWNIKSSLNIKSRICNIKDLSYYNNSYHDIDIESDKYRIEGILSLDLPTQKFKSLNQIAAAF